MAKFAPQSVRNALMGKTHEENRQMFDNICAVLRDDWHEPDESYITAKVFGDELDNAFGEALIAPAAGFQEMVVVLYQDKRPSCALNLATVLAGYARSLRPVNYEEVGESR